MAEFERGKAETVRDQSIKIRLSLDEKRRLEALAHGMGMTVASLVRFLCITNIQGTIAGGHSLDAWDKVRNYSEYLTAVNGFSGKVAKLQSDVNRIGNNLNQIARALNSRRPVDGSMLHDLEQAQLRLGDVNVRLVALSDSAERLADSYERLGDE